MLKFLPNQTVGIIICFIITFFMLDMNCNAAAVPNFKKNPSPLAGKYLSVIFFNCSLKYLNEIKFVIMYLPSVNYFTLKTKKEIL